MTGRLDWDLDGKDWPNRAASRFVDAGGVRFHVQVMGAGAPLLLLHGTGASTHSVARLAVLLSERFAVVAPDLPGHAFSHESARDQVSLAGMSTALTELLTEIDIRPTFAVGHSAGAAIAIRMTLDGGMTPQGLVSLSGALLPFEGFAGRFFAPLANLLALNPLLPHLVAWRAGDRRAVVNLLRETGSAVPEDSIDRYQRLFQSAPHVASTLAMMAAWDLDTLIGDLPRLAVPLHLVAAEKDGMVPPADAAKTAPMVRRGTVEELAGLGHLAHEERPDLVAHVIRDFAARTGAPVPL